MAYRYLRNPLYLSVAQVLSSPTLNPNPIPTRSSFPTLS